MAEKVIVPLDGSSRSEAVLARFRKLMSAESTELIVVHAVDRTITTDEVGSEAAWQSLWEEGQSYVGEVVARLKAQGARVESVLRPGRPADVVLEVAREQDATLIALTTHGRSGLARWALGSVAEKVLRASEAPVLLCRSFGEPGEKAAEILPRRILVPVEGGRRSLEIVQPAVRLAKFYGSGVHLLHVSDPDLNGTVPEVIRAREAFEVEGIPVDVTRRSGDPATEILDECLRSGSNVIAMTTHGRTGPARWALGSVTEKVLRAATVPMLLVRGFVPSTVAFGM